MVGQSRDLTDPLRRVVASMATLQDMNISLDDAKFFNKEIQRLVRGPRQGHDLGVIRITAPDREGS